MRINDRFFPSDDVVPESRHFLSSVVDGLQYNPPPPISNVPDVGDPILDEFYEKYYVPLGADFDLPADCINPDLKISGIEKRILEFCLDGRAETRIHVLHGHTGVGKSTLLRRILYYVYPRCQSLRNAFYPIYVPMSPGLGSKEPEEAFNKIADIVCRNAYPIIRREVLADPKEILDRVNLRGRKSYGRISQADIRNAAKDFERWMPSFLADQKARIDFYLDVLEILILNKKLRLVFALDDIDTFGGEVHTNTFLALDMLTSYGIHAVVATRTSTYESASARFLQNLDQRTELTLTSDSIWTILKRRVDLLDQVLRLHPDVAFRITQFETVSGRDVVDAFSRLISRKTCMKTLISLSNTNIKSIFSKLNLMAKSESFSDTFIVHQLLDREVVDPRKGQPSKVWIFYHLLLGNYAGTFRRDPEAQKAGIINVFDSSAVRNNPWRHFIKLNVLMHLYTNLRDSPNEESYTRCSEILENIKLAFGTSLRVSLFIEALSVLVQSELVFTESCRKYTRETINSDILSDAVRISTAGRFFLENLAQKVEYLYFIKDDIDWPLKEIPKDLTPAGRDYDRKVKFTAVLEALRLLIQQEYICLACLKAAWIGKDGYREALRGYRDRFSPYRLPESAGFIFCETILRSYKKYIKLVLSNSYYGLVIHITAATPNLRFGKSRILLTQMKTLGRFFFRPENRTQPICTEGVNGKCQFLFSEEDLFGCEAGGIQDSWAIKKSTRNPSLYLADFTNLLQYRNYRINTCPYRLRFRVMSVFSKRRQIKGKSDETTRPKLTLNLLAIGSGIAIIFALVLVFFNGWVPVKFVIFGIEFGQPTLTATSTVVPTSTATSAPTMLPALTTTQTITPTPIVPTATPFLPELAKITSRDNELVLCSTDPSRMAGIRIVALWLAQSSDGGFLVAVQEGMGIVEFQIRGWDYYSEKTFPLEETQVLSKCGHTANWASWQSVEPLTQYPAIGSIISVNFLGAGEKVLATVEFVVEEKSLGLLNTGQ